jgi:hypothetical protein
MEKTFKPNQKAITYSRPGSRNNQVLVTITTTEFVHARDVLELESHRDLVLLKFQEAGFAVIKFEELRYYYQPKHVIVEGIKGQSVLSL